MLDQKASVFARAVFPGRYPPSLAETNGLGAPASAPSSASIGSNGAFPYGIGRLFPTNTPQLNELWR